MATAQPTTYRLEIEGITIEVTRKRVKNFNFRATTTGEIRMSVPLSATREQVLEVVHKRIGWMHEAHDKMVQNRSGSDHAWESGETIAVWGEPVTLVVEDSTERVCVREGNVLHVYVPLSEPVTSRILLVEQWLTNEFKAYVDEVFPRIASRMRANVKEVTLRRMKTRWGSCTPRRKAIRLNIALVEMPKKCTDMVCTHELCHLSVPAHNEAFYLLMDDNMKDWKVWDRMLSERTPRQYGE